MTNHGNMSAAKPPSNIVPVCDELHLSARPICIVLDLPYSRLPVFLLLLKTAINEKNLMGPGFSPELFSFSEPGKGQTPGLSFATADDERGLIAKRRVADN